MTVIIQKGKSVTGRKRRTNCQVLFSRNLCDDPIWCTHIGSNLCMSASVSKNEQQNVRGTKKFFHHRFFYTTIPSNQHIVTFQVCSLTRATDKSNIHKFKKVFFFRQLCLHCHSFIGRWGRRLSPGWSGPLPHHPLVVFFAPSTAHPFLQWLSLPAGTLLWGSTEFST